MQIRTKYRTNPELPTGPKPLEHAYGIGEIREIGTLHGNADLPKS